MPMKEERLDQLARMMLARVNQLAKQRPDPPAIKIDAVTRSAITTRIRYLARAYDLEWLSEQATFCRARLSALDDAELVALLETMERARECRIDGIAFDDANLVHNTATMLAQSQRGRL